MFIYLFLVHFSFRQFWLYFYIHFVNSFVFIFGYLIWRSSWSKLIFVKNFSVFIVNDYIPVLKTVTADVFLLPRWICRTLFFRDCFIFVSFYFLFRTNCDTFYITWIVKRKVVIFCCYHKLSDYEKNRI